MVHICHLISIVLYYQYSPLPRSTILTLQGSGNRRLAKFISTNKKKGHSQIYFSQTSNWTKQGSTMLQSMIPHEKDQQDISHKWGRPYSSKTRVRYKTNVAQTTKQSGICIKFLFFLHDKFFFYLSRSKQIGTYHRKWLNLTLETNVQSPPALKQNIKNKSQSDSKGNTKGRPSDTCALIINTLAQ